MASVHTGNGNVQGEVGTAQNHANALLSLAIQDGVHGPVQVEHLTAYYVEVCFELGAEPLPMREVLRELGEVLEKKRVRQDGRQITYYWLPERKESNERQRTFKGWVDSPI